MAELPELETLRRELEKESVGKRFKVPEVVGAKVTKRNGNKKVFQGRLEGAKVKSVDRRGPYLSANLDNGELLLINLGDKGYLEKVAPRSTAPKGTLVTLAFTQGGQIRLVDTSGTAQAFVAAVDNLGEEAPELAEHRARPRRRSGVVDLVRPRAARQEREAQDAADGRRGRRRHRPDLQRRDPVGGRPAPRPRVERAVEPGDPSPVPCARRDAARSGEAPRAPRVDDHPFVDLYGKPGDHQDELRVHGREGEPCRRCRAPIVKIRYSNKPLFYCEACQV